VEGVELSWALSVLAAVVERASEDLTFAVNVALGLHEDGVAGTAETRVMTLVVAAKARRVEMKCIVVLGACCLLLAAFFLSTPMTMTMSSTVYCNHDKQECFFLFTFKHHAKVKR